MSPFDFDSTARELEETLFKLCDSSRLGWKGAHIRNLLTQALRETWDARGKADKRALIHTRCETLPMSAVRACCAAIDLAHTNVSALDSEAK